MLASSKLMLRGWQQCLTKAVRTKAIDHHLARGKQIAILGRSKNLSTPNTRRYSTCEDTRWLWEVSDVIKEYNEGNKHSTRTGGLEYVFNSVQPLEPEHFRQAFELFMQKAPNMRTVVRKRADSFWYCQLPNYKIDFEVLSNEDTFTDDCSSVLDKGFQETDSLPWKARVIRKEPTVHCPVLGVSKSHPHQCRLNIMFNHAVTDGTDLRFLNSCLLQSLNCVLGGLSPDETELGIFENNKDFEKLLQERERKLLEDPTKINSIRCSLPLLGEVPTVIQSFPRPDVSRPTTSYIRRSVDSLVMKGLLSKCSQKGVTFNSFSVAVCNVALAELMREAGSQRDTFKLYILLFVTSRRYRSAKKHLIGNYTTSLTYKSEVPRNPRDSFWEYCKRIDSELHSHYKEEGLLLDQIVVQKMMDAEHGPFNYTDKPRPVAHDYTQNHMADITKGFAIEGRYVQVMDVIPYQRIHNLRNPLVQEIYTFKGKTSYNFCYADNYFSRETVNLIADKIFHLFEVVGK